MPVQNHPGEHPAKRRFARWSVDSLTLRTLIVSLLALLMLIPLGFVAGMVSERGQRYASVQDDIANTWGERQTLVAPVLIIPFVETERLQETVVDNQGNSRLVDKVVRRHRTAQVLPTTLDINGTLHDETRQRGIFRSLVYTADLAVSATFPAIDINALSDNVETIQWDKAWLAMGLSDTSAINSVSLFSWNNNKLTLSPGTQLELLGTGFHAPIANLGAEAGSTLRVEMSIKGSGYFNFAPLGEITTVEIDSSWPHPSFQGRTLPESRSVSADGFSARWVVPHLARNFPQTFRNDAQVDLQEFTAGVSMFEPVSLYSRITRAVKYGILFIGLTFLTLLAFEFAIRKRLHVVQYGLIGCSLSLFYLVLLSLSEHMQFLGAYAIAAGLTISMITGYTWAVLGSVAKASVVFAMLASLYSILLSLLHLEDYALLMGTALLVVVVAILMLVTRAISSEMEPNN